MPIPHSETALPIAILGMAFRFPGGIATDDELWQALIQGRDVVGNIGDERWDSGRYLHPERAEPGRSVTFAAGVLDDPERFEPAFFGISPREAAWLDPQQRLLLELSWEALENAGIRPSALAGSDGAVFVGISGLDYGMRGLDDLASISGYTMTGNTLSIAANRLSYFYDLRGPSMAVDTACSSSLVAFHQACSSIERGEAGTALVCGVSLFFHPYGFIGFSKATMLSSNGRCRPFDAAGDGYVRSEGGGVLVLKRLDQAIDEGNSIRAVVLASGANADGGQKRGLTIPSAQGQARLMRRVLSRSGAAAPDIRHIEAHGTGTAVGDPVECAAIGSVYGIGRSSPLPVSSIKGNIGHLEAASGIAGLAKSILMLERGALVPSVHFRDANPNIDFQALGISVVTAHDALDSDSTSRPIVGVNSFGFGGANAHVLLQRAPALEYHAGHAGTGPLPPIVLSARTAESLRAMAGAYARRLADESPDGFYAIAYSLAHRRDHFAKRLAVTGESPSHVAMLLDAFAKGRCEPGVAQADEVAGPQRIAFVYSGNGAQWTGMGKALLHADESFRRDIEEVSDLIFRERGFDVRGALEGELPAERLADTSIAQPLLFAIQYALTRSLERRGVRPQAALGHSVGEVAAAWACGALSLGDAVRVVCERSAAQATIMGGGMLAVGLGEREAGAWLSSSGLESLEIAAINSGGQVTLAGSCLEIREAGARLAGEGRIARILDLPYAFHSRAMEPLEHSLRQALAGIRPGKSRIDFISTVSGQFLDGSMLDGDYWYRNVREPVRFSEAIASAVAYGCRILVEIGPHAILGRYMQEVLGATESPGSVIAAQRRGEDSRPHLDATALRIRLCATEPQWQVEFPRWAPHPSMPTYAWSRESFRKPRTVEGLRRFEPSPRHPLMGWRTEDGKAWERSLDTVAVPLLGDHRVAGTVLFPAAGFVECALSVARDTHAAGVLEVHDLEIRAPLPLPAGESRMIRVECPDRQGSFSIFSRPRMSEDPWTLHASARVVPPSPFVPADPVGYGESPIASIEAADLYRRCEASGLSYGPAFRRFHSGHFGIGWIAGEFVPGRPQADGQPYILDPTLLDSCFHSLVALAEFSGIHGDGALVPVRISRIRRFGAAMPTRFTGRLRPSRGEEPVADFQLRDERDAVCALIEGVRFRKVPSRAPRAIAPGRWCLEAIPKPALDAPAFLREASCESLATVARDALLHAESSLRRSRFRDQFAPLLDALVMAYAYEFFDRLARQGRLHVKLSDASGEATGEQRLFHRLASALEGAELLIRTDGQWRLDRSNPPPPAASIWSTMLSDYPDSHAMLDAIASRGESLDQILCVPGETPHAARGEPHAQSIDEFDMSDATRASEIAVLGIVDYAAAALPQEKRLRVLELTGHAQSIGCQFVPGAAAGRIDWVVVDAEGDEGSLQGGALSHPPFLKSGRLGSEGLLSVGQQPGPWAFDIVIARHWRPAEGGLAAMMGILRRYLADEGLLVLAERYPNLVADFMEWDGPVSSGQDRNREAPALASPSWWTHVLGEQGFGDAEWVDVTAGCRFLVLGRLSSVASSRPHAASSRWVIAVGPGSQDRDLADRLGARLEFMGHTARIIDYRALSGCEGTEGGALGGADDVVLLQVQPGSWDEATSGNGLRSPQQRLGPMAALRSAVAKGARGLRIHVITGGGAPLAAGDFVDRIDPDHALLWGFGRVAMNERPDLKIRLIDWQGPSDFRVDHERVCAELCGPGEEVEVVLTPESRYAIRLRSLDDAEAAPAPGDRFRIERPSTHQLRDLHWIPVPPAELEADQVEVRVQAVGVNFRDVMYSLSMLPEEAVEAGFAGPSLGLEFAGVITRTGPEAREFRKGDRVLGFASWSMASHVVTPKSAIRPMPSHWTFAEAATVPTAFVTAYYGLKHLAGMVEGESVLIHGAAGGVGIAALQVAQMLGAKTYCTAGSPDRRAFVRRLGADHVFDSRSTSYADEIRACTAGAGIDVVLNSLAGDGIARSLSVLRPFGRFVELGKRDYFENSSLNLRPFKDNISFFGVDADQLLVHRPELAHRLFGEIMDHFKEFRLHPLPHRCFPASRVVDAFRHLQQSKHFGKVVLDLGRAPALRQAPGRLAPRRPAARDATYLVTGGFEGLGLECAVRLAKSGAGHVILMSRRAADSPEAAEAVARVRGAGANAVALSCDVSNRGAVQAAFARILADFPPLRGIIHGAMVLDDALIADLDDERMARVTAPKVEGAVNLHLASLDLPIEQFVLLSSISVALGTRGQAAYAAANAFLESLAIWRRERGLPALCLALGPVGDVGYLSRNKELRKSLESLLGGELLTAEQAVDEMDRQLATGGRGAILAGISWEAVARTVSQPAWSRFEDLRDRKPERERHAGDVGDLRASIVRLPRAEALAMLRERVSGEVSATLGIPRDRLDAQAALSALGMDSLMAVEIAIGIEKQTGLTLPAFALDEHASVDGIAAWLLRHLLDGPTESNRGSDRIGEIAQVLAARHGVDMSAEDFEGAMAIARESRNGKELAA